MAAVQPSPDSSDASLFVGDGEMARLMRAHDWASTSLGPTAAWPNALKVAVRLLLTSKFEMWLGWGPDIAFLYNDAYRPTLGDKHPRSLAMATRELWPEIWSDIEGRLNAVYQRGEATWDRALQLLLNRRGYVEETYHTFSYSPLIGDDGKVEGVFCAVSEETDRVIGVRRLACLRELATSLQLADGRAGVLSAIELQLARNGHDMPFSLTYLFTGNGDAFLAGAAGIERGHALAPARVARRAGQWDLNRIWQGEASVLVDLVALPDNTGPLPTGAWDEAPLQAVLVPLPGQGAERPLGAMVVALNRHRPFDDDYLGFIHLLAGQMATGIASAERVEAERARAAHLADAARLRQQAGDALLRANDRLVSEVRQRTEERDRLRNLFEQAPSFMCLLQGPEHVFALVNEAYLQLVGHRSNLIGMTVRQALPEVEGQGFFELLDQVYRSGTPFVGRNLGVQIQRTPGAPIDQRYLHLVYQPIFEAGGEVSGIFVDGYDVTHQHQAEAALKALNETLEQRVGQRTEELAEALEQLRHESVVRAAAEAALRQVQRMESLGALTGGVAHDFNNLLQVIGGNLQLLSRLVAGNARAETRVQNALAGVARGAKLASQLLAFGRRQPLEPKVVNIGRFIKSMDDMLRRAIGEEIEVETVISGGLWNALVDPGQIENALLNLAINARDAMEGRGHLTIEAGNAMLDDAYARINDDVTVGQYVMVAVTDTGAGIPPQILDRVFEPFFSTKPEGKGTGLGLSMVYGFVKQSGGHIKIYSEVGEGTTVRVYLPRSHAPEDVVAEVDTGPARGGTETVLVVEDDEAVRETVVAIVADLGYRVLKARDAMSALSVIDSGVPVDLLFSDVVMPGPLRSPELARRARERLPNIAVLFTSGYAQNAIVHGGRLDVGVELLSKPYSREALARKLRHVLSNQAQRGLASAPRPAERALAPAAALTVLLVEDDDLIRANTADLLATEHYRVLQAADAESALRTLADHPVDVLLTDVGLPQISGTELARQALALRPDLAIVFATGDVQAVADVPVVNAIVLAKPYSQEELAESIARAARRRSEAVPPVTRPEPDSTRRDDA